MTPPAPDQPPVTVGAGAVVVRDNRILMVRTTYGWAAGRWVIPNGTQHPGESLQDCALRELREEAALTGQAGGIVAVRSLATAAGSDTFVALAVAAAPGEPHPDGRETDAARFLTVADVEALAARGKVVRLHRIIAHHVLDGTPQAPVQTMPALDRTGNRGSSTVYLLPPPSPAAP